MSNGVNAALGFQVEKSITAAPYTGQLGQYPIASGYNNNIFQGDLVARVDGFLVNYYDVCTAVPNTEPVQAIGIFAGCNITGQNLLQIGYGLPGAAYWPMLTLTNGGVPATGYVIEDPNVVGNIQCGATSVTFSMLGQMIGVNWTLATQNGIPNRVQGNFSTGQSSMIIDASATGKPGDGTYRPLMLIRTSPSNADLGPTPVQASAPYTNYECVIANHQYRLSSRGN